MSDDWRGELIFGMARIAWQNDGIRNQPDPEAKATYLRQARAQLELAEAVIREKCAHEANKRMVDADDYGAHLCEDIAAAILEGGGNGD